MGEGSVLRVAVFASGSGSNLQALLDHFHGAAGGSPAERAREPAAWSDVTAPDSPVEPASPEDDSRSARVVLLVVSRKGIGAEKRARRVNVPVVVLPEQPRVADAAVESRFLLEALHDHRADLVVLAGWLRLVPSAVVGAFRSRMLNIHPALLPAFGGRGMYGRHVHRAVLASGARVSGPTVHLVDEEYDRGPILAQWPVPVLEDDDEERLASRVLEAEHRLLPAVVEALAREWTATGGGAEGGGGEATPRFPWLHGRRFLLEGPRGPQWIPGRGRGAGLEETRSERRRA